MTDRTPGQGDGRHDGNGVRDEDGVRDFVEHLAMTLAGWGFPRMPARVLMALTVADEPSLSAADLAGRLGVSPAAISGAVRYLIQLRMAARVPVPGSRRDHYRLPDHPWYQVSFEKIGMFGIIAGMADGGLAALGGPRTPSGARVEEMRDFFLFLQEELDVLLAKWRERQAGQAGRDNHATTARVPDGSPPAAATPAAADSAR